MTDKNKEAGVFASSFYVDAAIKSNQKRILADLKSIGAFRLLSEGTAIKYEVLDDVATNAVLKLETDRIIFTFYYDKLSKSVYKVNMIKFLSILQILDKHYEIRLAGLYGACIEVLRGDYETAGQNNSTMLIERLYNYVDVLNLANIKLSKEAYSLQGELVKANGVLSLYRSFYSKVVASLSSLGVDPSKELIEHFGVEKSLLSGLGEDVDKAGI